MNCKIMPLFGSLNALFFCAGLSLPSLPLLASIETASSSSTTPTPSSSSSTSSPYNRDLCDNESLSCGVEYVDKEVNPSCRTPQRFENYENSELEGYNLSTFMNGQGKYYRDFCVDHTLLNNENAGYALDQLDGIQLAGAFKVQQLNTGSISYIPFRTTPLKKRKANNSERAVYGFELLENPEPIELLTDRAVGTGVRKWLAESAGMDKADIPLYEKINLVKNLTNAEMKKLKIDQRFPNPSTLIDHFPRTDEITSLSPVSPKSAGSIAPRVRMTLTRSEWFSGKTYDIRLSSFLPFPSENMRVDFISGGTARLARMGYKNFRTDWRYTRSISLVPSPKSIKAGHHINRDEKLIEIILVSPSYPSDILVSPSSPDE